MPDKNNQGAKAARATQARSLANNQLLQEILDQRKADIFQQWQSAGSIEGREEAWQALRQLELLAGAITDGIKRAIEDGGGDA